MKIALSGGARFSTLAIPGGQARDHPGTQGSRKEMVPQNVIKSLKQLAASPNGSKLVDAVIVAGSLACISLRTLQMVPRINGRALIVRNGAGDHEPQQLYGMRC
jgi:hypothetical protein